MAYIGKSPVIGNFVKLDAITAVNGQAAYTMQNGGSNFTDYESVNQFLVSLNGTIQAPTDSFTVSGSTLTFASNLSTGDVIDFIMVFGNSLSAGTPTDATVSTAKIVDDAVTAAKINNDIISGSTELASEPADTDEFLVSDAGTLKRIDYSLIKGGGVTEIDRWGHSDGNLSNGDFFTSWTRYSTLSGVPHGTGVSHSSGVFTLPSTGVYKVTFESNLFSGGSTTRAYVGIDIQGSNDGFSSNSQTLMINYGNTSTGGDHDAIFLSAIYDVTNTSNNKVRFKVVSIGSCGFYNAAATFIKLMET